MLATLAACALIGLADPPAAKGPPADAELAAITGRGRDLAGYDAAAWHASDAVQARGIKPGSVAQYIARKTEKGWMVAFGRMNPARDKFLIAYEATAGKDPEKFEVKGYDKPREDAGFFRSAARGYDLAVKDFTDHLEGPKRPYNVAILPAEKGQFWVYLVPAPTQPGIWPLGGDARYLVSPDGSKIVARRQLHKSIIEKAPPPKGEGQQQVAGMHTHILDEIPEDTDVFHVLSRKPAMPEIVVTGKFVFAVEPDGAIKYMGKPDELMPKK